MKPFFSAKANRKDQLAARVLVCLFALLFFISAAVSALPSFSAATGLMTENGLAGYSTEPSTQPNKHESAIKQFSDRPSPSKTSSPKPSSETDDPLPTPSVGAEKISL